MVEKYVAYKLDSLEVDIKLFRNTTCMPKAEEIYWKL